MLPSIRFLHISVLLKKFKLDKALDLYLALHVLIYYHLERENTPTLPALQTKLIYTNFLIMFIITRLIHVLGSAKPSHNYILNLFRVLKIKKCNINEFSPKYSLQDSGKIYEVSTTGQTITVIHGLYERINITRTLSCNLY